MSTASYTAFKQQLRALLLATPDPDGHTAAETLGERLYLDQAPDDVQFPYGVLRLAIRGIGVGGARVSGELEVMVYGRPRSSQPVVQAAVDRMMQALLQLQDTSSGLVMGNVTGRETLEVPPEPADREVVQVRLTAGIVAYPLFVTRCDTPAVS